MASDVSQQQFRQLETRLGQKEQELKEVQSEFSKYKLKTKLRFEQFRIEIEDRLQSGGLDDGEHPALVLLRLREAEQKLEEAEKSSGQLQADIARRDIRLHEQHSLIQELEKQLRRADDELLALKTKVADYEQREGTDVEKVLAQLKRKDERILELNNTILERERSILDLQEACREQGELATAKQRAVQIVQQRFRELDARRTRDVGTETDDALTASPRREAASRRSGRSTSPGHVVPARMALSLPHRTNSSPPPLDPAEEDELDLDAVDRFVPSTSTKTPDRKKSAAPYSGRRSGGTPGTSTSGSASKKVVTFSDQPGGAALADVIDRDRVSDERLAAALMELTRENDELRDRLERAELLVGRISELETLAEEAEREARSASLRARNAASIRIRQLEERLNADTLAHDDEIKRLTEELDAVRAGRDWEVAENGRMRDQLTSLREKLQSLRDEVDAVEAHRRDLQEKLDESDTLCQQLLLGVEESDLEVQRLQSQRDSILDDVDRLKEAILAQQDYIELLEADQVIFEEHIGLLRESLGASRIDHRALIRSKAFETKLRALQQERDKFEQRSNEERERARDLRTRLRRQETENERLMAKLCEIEMMQLQQTDDEDAMHRQAKETTRQLEERSAQLEAAERRIDDLQLRLRLKGNDDGSDERTTDIRAQEEQEEEEERKEQLQEVQARLDDREQEVARLGAENFELTRRILELEHRVQEGAHLQDVQQQLEEARAEARRIREQYAELEADYALARQQLDEFVERERLRPSTSESQVGNQLPALDALRQQNYEQESRIIELEGALALAEKRAAQLAMELDEAQEESDVLKAQGSRRMAPSVEVQPRENPQQQQEIDRLSTEVRRLEVELQELRDTPQQNHQQLEIGRLETELHEEARVNAQNRQEVERLRAEIDRLEAELQQKQAEIDLLEAQLAALSKNQAELDRLKEETAETQKEADGNEQYRLEVDRLTQELQEARAKIEADKMEKKKLKAAVKKLMEERKPAAEEKPQQQLIDPKEKEELEKQLAEARAKIEADRAEKSKLKAAVRKLKSDLEQAQKHVDVPEAKVEIVTPLQSSSGGGTAEPSNFPENRSNHEVEQLETTVNALRAEIAEKTAQFERQRQEDYERMVEARRQELEHLQSAAEQATSTLREEHDAKVDQIQALKHELQQLRESESEKEAALQKELQEREKEIEHLKIALAERSQAQDSALETQKLQSQLSEREQQLAMWATEWEKYQEYLTSVQRDAESKSAEIQSLKLELRQQEVDFERRRALEQVESETLQRSAATDNTLQLELRAKVAELEGVRSLLEERERREVDLIDDVARVKEELTELQGQLENAHEVEQRDRELRLQELATLERRLEEERAAKVSIEQEAKQLRDQLASGDVSRTEESATLERRLQEELTAKLSIEQEVKGLRDQMASGYAAYEALVDENTKLAERNSTLEAELARQRAESECLAADGEELCVQNSKLQKDIEEMREKILTPPIAATISPRTAGDEEVHSLRSDNSVLRDCVQETMLMQSEVGEQVGRLMELNADLERAVDGLSGEIWSLKGQLKTSIVDREGLTDKVTGIEENSEADRRRVVELEEQLKKQQEELAELERTSQEDVQTRRELETQFHDLHSRHLALQTEFEELQTARERDAAQLSEKGKRLRSAVEQLAELRAQLVELRQQLGNFAKGLVAALKQSEEGSPLRKPEKLENVTTTRGSSQDDELRGLFDLLEVNSLSGMRDALVDRLDEISSLRHLVDRHRENADRLERRLREVDGGVAEPDDWYSTSTTTTSAADVDRLEGELKVARSELDRLQAQLSTLNSARDLCAEAGVSLDEIDCLAAGDDAEDNGTNNNSLLPILRHHVRRLAARLATRQADTDALFAANAELAHSGVELRNRLDEAETQRDDLLLKVEQLEKTTEREHQLRALIEERDAEISELRTQLENVATDGGGGEEARSLADLRAQYDTLLEDARRASDRISELEKTVEKLTQERDKLRAVVDKVKALKKAKAAATGKGKDNDESHHAQEPDRKEPVNPPAVVDEKPAAEEQEKDGWDDRAENWGDPADQHHEQPKVREDSTKEQERGDGWDDKEDDDWGNREDQRSNSRVQADERRTASGGAQEEEEEKDEATGWNEEESDWTDRAADQRPATPDVERREPTKTTSAGWGEDGDWGEEEEKEEEEEPLPPARNTDHIDQEKRDRSSQGVAEEEDGDWGENW